MQQVMSPVIQSLQQHLKKVINFKSDLLVHIIQHMISSIISAPSSPPEGIPVSNKMTFSITVEWQAVPCIHRNGNITGYAIIYHMQDNDRKYSSGTAFTIPDLQPSTTYVISVAAVNSEGIGIYGTITASTLPCELYFCRNVTVIRLF